MDFNVYCDESYLDCMTSSRCDIAKYMAIGSIWLKQEDTQKIKDDIKKADKGITHCEVEVVLPDTLKITIKEQVVWLSTKHTGFRKNFKRRFILNCP